MSVTVVMRPPLFCAVCGMAMRTVTIGTQDREVWCANTPCPQFNEHATFTDPVMTHLSRGVIASVQMALDLNPQPREH